MSEFMDRRERSASYIRNFVFGVEDSLVSTVGLLSGIAIAAVPRETILLTGIVLVFVEAFSMAAGSFLSEYSAEEYMNSGDARPRQPLWSGLIMFFSYFLSGFVPLFPYMLMETAKAFKLSVGLSLVALFILGVVGAKLSNRSLVKRGIRMLLVGGIAIGVGILAANITSFFA